MKKFWQIKGVKVMQIGVAETVSFNLKHRKGVFYWDNVDPMRTLNGTALSGYAGKVEVARWSG